MLERGLVACEAKSVAHVPLMAMPPPLTSFTQLNTIVLPSVFSNKSIHVSK